MKKSFLLFRFHWVKLILVLLPLACSQKSPQMDEPIMQPSADMKLQPLPNENATEGIPADALKTVYFDYDMSRLREDAKKILKENAAWLGKHPKVKIQIEGHCDERGTKQYNLNLGEKRARIVMEYLKSLGVEADRMTTLSIGADPGEGENEWQHNRKAVFLITETH